MTHLKRLAFISLADLRGDSKNQFGEADPKVDKRHKRSDWKGRFSRYINSCADRNSAYSLVRVVAALRRVASRIGDRILRINGLVLDFDSNVEPSLRETQWHIVSEIIARAASRRGG